jgi:hypothetical protein
MMDICASLILINVLQGLFGMGNIALQIQLNALLEHFGMGFHANYFKVNARIT